MPKTKSQKQEIIEKIKDKMDSSGFMAFLNFHGLSVAKSTELRKILKKTESSYMVSKKTLISVAAKDARLEIEKKNLEGEISVVFTEKDDDKVLSVCKDLVSFAKKNSEILKIVGGLWDKHWTDSNQIKYFASIPSRDVLLTQLAFILSQPVASFARVLNKLSEKIKVNN